MGNNIARRQHYVPVFYLEFFANDNGKVCVLDRKDDRFFLASPRKVCVENMIYETRSEDPRNEEGYVLRNQLEKQLSSQEGEYKTAIENVLKKCQSNMNNPRALICNTEEKQVLGDFVVNMYLRNPYIFESILSCDYKLEQLKKTNEVQTIYELCKHLGVTDIDALTIHATKSGIFARNIAGSPTNVWGQKISNMNHSFFVSKENSFITSSFPVLGTEYLTEKHEHRELIMLPLSPQVLLVYTNKQVLKSKRNRIEHIDNSFVEEINGLYLKADIHQIRYLIACDKQKLEHI